MILRRIVQLSGSVARCCVAVSLLVGSPALAKKDKGSGGSAGEKGSDAGDKGKGRDKEKENASRQAEVDALFNGARIPVLTLQIAGPEMEALRKDARTYVKCRLVEEGGRTYSDVAVKLKGAAGSFQPIDDRPAFTLNVDKFAPDQLFHGLDKLHLNNAVQDETFLHELLCSELFRKAGVPAPQVTHARLKLNDRDMGVYVLKAGFDKAFLKRHFASAKGNLYDGGFCQEIDGDLDRDEGKGVDDRSDLKALAEACGLPDEAERIEAIGMRLNVEAFITFMAMEAMTGHWDGYCSNRNNYRIYFNPDDGNRAQFLPHGMDQMFGDPNASILGEPQSLVGSVVMRHPAWRQKYRERVRELLPLFEAPTVTKIVEGAYARLRPVFATMGEEVVKRQDERTADLIGRLTARAENLREQSVKPEPEPLAFGEGGVAALEEWEPKVESGDPAMDRGPLPHGKGEGYSIVAGGEETIASWRVSVLLEAGDYSLKGRLRTKDVKPIAGDDKVGAGLRISGEGRENSRVGTGDWAEATYDFTIDGRRTVELVAELRGRAGSRVWFDQRSLKLVKKAR